jgi:hypothetical protein
MVYIGCSRRALADMETALLRELGPPIGTPRHSRGLVQPTRPEGGGMGIRFETNL